MVARQPQTRNWGDDVTMQAPEVPGVAAFVAPHNQNHVASHVFHRIIAPIILKQYPMPGI